MQVSRDSLIQSDCGRTTVGIAKTNGGAGMRWRQYILHYTLFNGSDGEGLYDLCGFFGKLIVANVAT